MSTTFGSLAVRNYRLWFACALISNVGTWMQRIAQDWLVLTELTDNDAQAVGITIGLQFAPMLLLLPWTGMVADRFDRRKVLYVTQSVSLAVGVALAIVTLAGVVNLALVYSLAFALGLASAFDSPARLAFIGELVPNDRLANAVSLNSASFNSARLIGPGIAGLLIAVVGLGWVFVLNAFSFLAVLIAIAAIRTKDLVPVERAPGVSGTLWEALRYVRGRPDIVLVLVLIFIWGTFGMNFPIFISSMTRITFDLGPEAFGILSSILAIGTVSGALLSAHRESPRIGVIAWAASGATLALILGGLAPDPWVFGLSLALSGIAAITIMTTANSYVQVATAPAMRGRVMALYLALFAGGTPIGAPLMGFIAQVGGPRAAMLAAAGTTLVLVVIAVIYLIRTASLRISWVPERRWPLRFTGRAADRPLAEAEIALTETEDEKT
ncbi:MFS transporter [Microbacterium pygmaeum]|uniref:Predicted arabinose efflux permease, MFS family n=1 Tax=Microbacterium pygmaeum TaxID=370764 RepID=A0A1G7XKL6_9MICO|nr:MFS transporter [Microbacterium pygmaeum]SDG84603.1 Predicted arabinose efflux permease, MFS family [Microbacterium pygmaeum]